MLDLPLAHHTSNVTTTGGKAHESRHGSKNLHKHCRKSPSCWFAHMVIMPPMKTEKGSS